MIDQISGDFLQWLRGFYYVTEEGSIRQAALAMGREKPTISRQIKRLEQELGVALFDRSSGKLVITPEGIKLQEKANVLFECVKDIKDTFRDDELLFEGDISIAASPAIIHNFLPPYFESFRKRFPKTIFHLDGATRERICEKVESARVDFGICFLEPTEQTFSHYPLFESGLVLIAPKNNPYFSAEGTPSLQQIAKTPLILMAHQGVVSPLFSSPFIQKGLQMNIIMTHNNFHSIKMCVAQGMGISFLGQHAILPHDEEMFDIYNLDSYFQIRKYGVVLKKKKYISPLVRAFLESLKPDISLPSIRDTYIE